MSDSELEKYREWLISADHTASLNFDKSVMTLAGGALALSLTFLHDIVPTPVATSKPWLFVSWVSLSVSLTAILVSYLFSMGALRKAIRQVDSRSINTDRLGGWQTILTEILRYAAAVCFVIGVLSFLWFTQLNY
jgi:hypothetical protein